MSSLIWYLYNGIKSIIKQCFINFFDWLISWIFIIQSQKKSYIKLSLAHIIYNLIGWEECNIYHITLQILHSDNWNIFKENKNKYIKNKNFGGTNYRTFFCPNINPSEFLICPKLFPTKFFRKKFFLFLQKFICK